MAAFLAGNLTGRIPIKYPEHNYYNIN